MKKILFSIFAFVLFLSSIIFAYSDSVFVPNPSEFNKALRKIGRPNYYWNYDRYFPSSIVVVREKSNNNILYFPTLSSSIIVDGKSLRFDSSDYRFYAFMMKDEGVNPVGGIVGNIDLNRYDILFITNAYTPDGQKLDNLGGLDSIGNDSWGDSIEFEIDSSVPNFGFDLDNGNINNSFFSSLVSYFKELISSFKKYFVFAGKVADRILSIFSDTYRLIKRFFDDFIKLSKFLIDFFNENNFFEWLLKVFKRAFIVQPDYFKNKIDGLFKLVDSKINIPNYKVLFSTMEFMKTQPFDDFSVRLYLFNSEINFVLVRAEFLNKASSYFRPLIGWFLYFFLGLYHFDQIYFLIRGTKYFNGKHTSTEMRK